MEHYENFTENINPPHQHPLREKITGGTLEVRSDKSLTLLTFDIQPMDKWTNGPFIGPMVQWS